MSVRRRVADRTKRERGASGNGLGAERRVIEFRLARVRPAL